MSKLMNTLMAALLIGLPAPVAEAFASDLTEQYDECWREAAVGKLSASISTTSKQAEDAVMASIDYADTVCVQLARQAWRTMGEQTWVEQHRSLMVQFSHANLSNVPD